jgi:uncharacterized protein
VLESLDGPALRRWMRVAWHGLGRERAEIDALNVFPVADSDTGTNMHLTVEAVVATSGSDDQAGALDPAEALAVLARGALVGARGNSGLILAELLRGMALGYAQAGTLRPGRALAIALASGADHARVAVAAPVAGTILSVADAAADAARSACVVGVDDLPAVAGAAAAAAATALARTPSQLAVLADAGVVDAGGRGLVVVLDALVATVVDADLPEPASLDGATSAPVAEPAHRVAALSPDTGLGFEVMYGLEASEPHATALRAHLADIGDSVVVSGGDGFWAVHVHLADVGAALDAGLAAGQVSAVRVTPLTVGSVARAVVVIAPGEGLSALLVQAGGTVVPAGATSATPAQIVAAVRATGAGEVVLLPSAPTVIAAATAAARVVGRAGVRAQVVPTRAVVQSLAALAVHDPARSFDDDVVSMTAAAVATRYGGLTHAVRAALTTVGRCSPGDVLGLVGEDVVSFDRTAGAVADVVVDRLLAAGGELVTLVSGAGAEPGLVDGVVDRLRSTHPGVAVLTYDGGAPDQPLQVGVE